MGFLAAIPAALTSGLQAASAFASTAVHGLTSASSLIGGANGGSISSALGSEALKTGISILGAKAAGSALTPPKPPAPPQPPNPASLFTRLPTLIGPSEGSSNGTFLTGSNRAANISGGKKTLLGQ